MTLWTALVVIAVIWAFVTIWSRSNDRDLGVTRDEDGNPIFTPRNDENARAAEAEIAELKERLAVLERIATDANSADARERARITAEIEALREPDGDGSGTKSPPTSASSDA